MVGARITGQDDLRRTLAGLSAKFTRQVVREASFTAAIDTERHIVTAIQQGPATGKMRKGGKSRASAPGEYPMTDMGVLAASIASERKRDGADVVARAPYAERLELKDPARGGRPFMRRGLQENESRIHQIVLWAARRILQRP